MPKTNRRTFVSKLVALAYFTLEKRKSFSELFPNADYSKKNLVPEPRQKMVDISTVAITAHIYYPEFTRELFNLTKDWPPGSSLFITTMENKQESEIRKLFSNRDFNLDIRVVPNVGRNFGPLLVEFSSELQNYEFFLHVHSKKSNHGPSGLGSNWANRSFDLLLDPVKLGRALTLMKTSPKLAISFAESRDLLRGMNFRWGQSRKVTQKLVGTLGITDELRWQGPISFPAGGMFLCRSSAFIEILSFPWSYDMFPFETGQIDGTLQHGIERLFGELPLAKGFSQAVYVKKLDGFYVESTDILIKARKSSRNENA